MQAVRPVEALRLQAHERKLVRGLGILAMRRSRRKQTEVRRDPSLDLASRVPSPYD